MALRATCSRIIQLTTYTHLRITRINFSFQSARCPWTVDRRQFPLRLAYAITFNSCQGLTLDRVVLNLRSDVFAHSKLYTVVSRFRNRSCIRRLMPGDTPDGEHSTANIVHKVLLLGTWNLALTGGIINRK